MGKAGERERHPIVAKTLPVGILLLDLTPNKALAIGLVLAPLC
jgi:hypothetical protein